MGTKTERGAGMSDDCVGFERLIERMNVLLERLDRMGKVIDELRDAVLK